MHHGQRLLSFLKIRTFRSPTCFYSAYGVPVALLVKLGSLPTLELAQRIGDAHAGELVSVVITGMIILDALTTCSTPV